MALQMEAFGIDASERESATVKSGSSSLSVASILAWADALADEGLAGLSANSSTTIAALPTALPSLVGALKDLREGLEDRCPRFCHPLLRAGLSDLVAAGSSLRTAVG